MFDTTQKHEKSREVFQLDDLGEAYADIIMGLYHKGAIEAPDFKRTTPLKRQGLSLNIESLPSQVVV